ncbi:phage recombination protein Bet [Streptomyces sp. NPDC057217]|uniref:phage recombination protein Bet n=1 Tax=Streptomyces sp. NPDC057217 TaxID=3346054 RepID=UPI0036268880
MTVTTLPTAHIASPAPAATAGALAIRPEQTSWTPEQAAVLRQSGIKEQVTSAELAGFLHLCQRTGLDPFSRQIYLIGRWSKKDGRDVYTPQTGIDGYRVIAQRVTAQTGGTYGYEDTVWCDPSGRWRDVWLATEPPAAAKVTVIRNGQRFSAVATFREYVQTFPDGNPKGLWAKMPAGQIAKCAEALALRKAFPHDLAGVYTDEEMAQADNPAPQMQAAPQQADEWATAAPRRDYLAEARAAGTVDEVREIYRAAMAEFGPGTATAQEIAEIGRQLAASSETPTADLDPAAEAAYDGPRNGGTPETAAEHADGAEEALRLAASRANLLTLDADFERVYGLPISEAGAVQLHAFRKKIEGAA